MVDIFILIMVQEGSPCTLHWAEHVRLEGEITGQNLTLTEAAGTDDGK